jgi:formamidopyrimidine-DNA glycosylase
MPEGHTLHRLARSQQAQFAGSTIRVTSPQGRFTDAALVDGLVLDRVSAYGKHLFAAFGDRIVHVHLGLFGKYAAGVRGAPPPRGAIRMRWEAESGWTDLRGPTACAVVSPSEVDAILARLGPDPLRARADGHRAYVRIARSKAPVAGLLMDQAVLAGVGNVYRAEVLFRQRIDPYLPGRQLDEARWAPLWADLVTLMRAGLRAGRIVTTERGDRQSRRGTARWDDSHYVYRRAGLPCRICATPVAMQELAARKLYWCPVCQDA